MKTFAPIVSLLLCAGLLAGQTAIPYRLIDTRHSSPTDSVREFEYNISVEQHLDAASIRNTVCQVVKSEKPPAYEVLAISIYYKLERYAPEESAELRERRIARYHWSKDSQKDKRRLVLFKDAKGQSLSEWRFYDFDHTKACR